jgi:hypothetical protein
MMAEIAGDPVMAGRLACADVVLETNKPENLRYYMAYRYRNGQSFETYCRAGLSIFFTRGLNRSTRQDERTNSFLSVAGENGMSYRRRSTTVAFLALDQVPEKFKIGISQPVQQQSSRQ